MSPHYPALTLSTTEPSDLAPTAIFWHISSLALPMALSYTFGLQMFYLVFLSRLSSDETDEAAITPITSMIYAMNMVGITVLLAMSIVAGKQIGALKVVKNNIKHCKDTRL